MDTIITGEAYLVMHVDFWPASIVVQHRQDFKMVSVGWYPSSVTTVVQGVSLDVIQVPDSDLDPMSPGSTHGC